MPSKWNRVRGSLGRAHDDLFEDTEYQAEFYNHSGGSYNPDTGQIEGDTRSKIGSTTVELVPPAMDTTVETDGTSMSWDTSIRSSLTVYELHGYSIERGSGMVMCRLVEQ